MGCSARSGTPVSVRQFQLPAFCSAGPKNAKRKLRHDCAAQRLPRADHMQIDDVRDTDQHDDEHLPTDALEAHLAGELLISNCAHQTGDVVDHHENDERSHQAVHTSYEIAEIAADGSSSRLNLGPDQMSLPLLASNGYLHDTLKDNFNYADSSEFGN